MTKFSGDKTDVTALVSYAQSLEAEIERLRAALEELKTLGEQGMEPDYSKWLTFHDKVAKVAADALNQQQRDKE